MIGKRSQSVAWLSILLGLPMDVSAKPPCTKHTEHGTTDADPGFAYLQCQVRAFDGKTTVVAKYAWSESDLVADNGRHAEEVKCAVPNPTDGTMHFCFAAEMDRSHRHQALYFSCHVDKGPRLYTRQRDKVAPARAARVDDPYPQVMLPSSEVAQLGEAQTGTLSLKVDSDKGTKYSDYGRLAGVSAAEIKAANGPTFRLTDGRDIAIPSATSYTMLEGESLGRVADIFNVTVDELKVANPLVTEFHAGTSVIVPRKFPSKVLIDGAVEAVANAADSSRPEIKLLQGPDNTVFVASETPTSFEYLYVVETDTTDWRIREIAAANGEGTVVPGRIVTTITPPVEGTFQACADCAIQATGMIDGSQIW